MNLRDFSSVADRRKALEKELSLTVPHIGCYTLDDAQAAARNCENMIGVTQVPLGIAGPLLVGDQESAGKARYIPLATTEGALVASVNRGSKAITMSGGAIVDVQKVGATRGPAFRVNGINEGKKLSEFLDTRFGELKKIAEATSHHLTLSSFTVSGVGTYRFVRFVFDTADAMGLNMVTIATEAMAAYIKTQTGISCVALSGNFCVDKKPAWQNAVHGRGFQVWAEVTLPEAVLREVLKTSAAAAYDVWLAKCMIGSALSGSMGFNAQYANIVAAVFIATGQDPAHVVEGSLGITACEVQGGDLYVSVYLPDLLLGTVGGGTGLATQKEALAILGVTTSHELAEVVGAAALAGEISLLSSLEQGTLARAHSALGRGGK